MQKQSFKKNKNAVPFIIIMLVVAFIVLIGFSLIQNIFPVHTLTVNAVNGTVAKNPDVASYAPGTIVTLTAKPNLGYAFSAWSGDLTGTANPAAITMNSNKTITANFSLLSGTIVSIASATAAPGASDISIPITVGGFGTEKIYAIDLTLTYDKDLVTPASVQKGSAISNWSIVPNISIPGEIRMGLYSTTELSSAGGEIAKVLFNVKTNATTGTKSNLTLTRAILNETPASNKINGEFSIK